LPAESQWWFDSVAPHFASETNQAALGFDDEVMHWQLSRCSSGEKQRLAVLRLLANRPKVLLLDEPTANLDPENTGKVEALIAEYLAGNRAVAIWVSHNRAHLERVASERYFDFSRAGMVKIKQGVSS
jgi:ABC-type iron transport system FetAB ATPase subunit